MYPFDNFMNLCVCVCSGPSLSDGQHCQDRVRTRRAKVERQYAAVQRILMSHLGSAGVLRASQPR